MAKKAKEVEEVEQAVEPVVKSKEPRMSNNDVYEWLTSIKADVDKEMNLRKQSQRPGVITPENAAQLVGLSQGLTQLTVRFKIYAKPSKAF